VLSVYEDPGKPINEKITLLTGITDSMVGLLIDDDILSDWLNKDTFQFIETVN